jgi:hypothetical protein
VNIYHGNHTIIVTEDEMEGTIQIALEQDSGHILAIAVQHHKSSKGSKKNI